ncbi:MAG: complex I NDUFA9 subunit family protein [Proteobacteria bacterium]|nr:complex I NDUFA9 subunit family protein [Pseudomonadota bacterium]
MALPTLVVLGGSGFVGRDVVAKAVAANWRVVVVTRRRADARTLFALPTADIVEGDVCEPGVLARVLRGADAVVNLVGILNERGRETFARVHVELARNVVATCVAEGVPRLVHMSALNAAPDAPSAYLASKGEAEAIVTASPLAWTVVRPSVIFGAGDTFLNRFVQLARIAPVFPLAGANARFQPVWVRDVAECIVRALTLDATLRQRYDLCGPQVYTLEELVKWTLAIAGVARPILPVGDALANVQAAVLERLPGALLTRDNLKSMRCDSVCSAAFPPVFGVVPERLEAVAPQWLSPAAAHDRYDVFRMRSGR